MTRSRVREVSRGLRPWSRPFLVFALLAGASLPARGQDPVRPWLDWRTTTTRNYRFHFPRELEAWTNATAARVESIDSAIVALVGYAPPRPIDVVVDDPYTIANGYALPFIERPVSVWWATPPDPRTDIGNYRTWGEMLATHELTHIAHLTRPSRNPFQRALWSSLPANLGPIARNAPRWVYEGYATFIEGRISGTGRPNNVWRPALLRQWAIEGHLPGYGQLSAWNDYQGGEFAYLGGSAFLEWLAQSHGDSSLVLVWRRMTARVTRGFDAAFDGVYGDRPAVLYGRHVAELTRDAMAAKALLEHAGLVEGKLIQHLFWETGDPALSPDGDRVAVTIRQGDRPSSVVIWSTAQEALDTAALRKRIDEQKRDPQDVPDRRVYPAPKKVIKNLRAKNGFSYARPRWLPDGKRLVVTRWSPRSDGTLRPDLFIWAPDSDKVRRVTHGAAIMDADPSPITNAAVATRCRAGTCDVVSVDLARGRVTALLAGSVDRSYYRPRFSRDGRRFVVNANEGGKWRVAVADANGANLRFVDPADGVNRYDAQWLRGGDSLVVVSERGGIPNLELIALEGGAPRTLTRVTGAALAPDVSGRDGSVWFLSMHSRGLDVRSLERDVAPADSAIAIGAERFGFAGVHVAAPREPRKESVSSTRPYGAGPRRQRWVPGASYSVEGAGAFVSIFSGDIVGRLNAALTAAIGERGTVAGGALRAAWRFPRPTIEAGVHAFLHEPSRARYAQAGTDSLDAGVLQSVLAASMQRQGDGWSVRARAGAAAGILDPTLGPTHVRRLEFAEAAMRLRQSTGSAGIVERASIHAAQGRTRGDYVRVLTNIGIATVGRDAFPLDMQITVGKLAGDPHPFDLLSVGGAQSPVSDSSIMSQRYAMPLLPFAVSAGKALFAWRVALPTDTWTLFYAGAGTARDVDLIRKWNRAVGAELRYALPPVPAAFSPRIESRGGFGYTLDEPFRHRVRLYLEMIVEP